jgi:prepilin-type N-terminal cleavage/methylation domain-containing protein
VKRITHNSGPPRPGRGQAGFTLLEIIVTIAIAAIMGVFFAQFVYTGVIHSVDPVRQVQNTSRASEVMEKMTAYYKSLAATQSNFLPIFKDYVEYGNELAHPESRAGYPYFGSYQNIHNKYITFVSGAEEEDNNAANQRVLKVTIRCGDQTVTSLFTR